MSTPEEEIATMKVQLGRLAHAVVGLMDAVYGVPPDLFPILEDEMPPDLDSRQQARFRQNFAWRKEMASRREALRRDTEASDGR